MKAFLGYPIREEEKNRVDLGAVRAMQGAVRKKFLSRRGMPGNAFTCLHLARSLSRFMQLRVKAFYGRAFTVPSPSPVSGVLGC